MRRVEGEGSGVLSAYRASHLCHFVQRAAALGLALLLPPALHILLLLLLRCRL